MPSLDEALQMAMTRHRAGQFDVAAEMYRQIIEQVPQHPDAWHLLGTLEHQRGNDLRALELIERAISLSDSQSTYYSNRGDTLRALGRLPEAEKSLRRAVELDPTFADGWNNLGLVLDALGQPLAAIEAFDRALAVRPGYPEVLNNRGLMYERLGRKAEALVDYQETLRRKPDYAQAHNNLGSLYHHQGQFEPAQRCYEEAIRLFPNYSEALGNLGLVLWARGQQEEAAVMFRRAVTANPKNTSSFSNLLLNEQYRTGATPAGLLDLHGQWDRQFGEPLKSEWRPHGNSRALDRTLRLGFISADLYRHPVASLLEQVFERLDRRQFAIHVYSNRLAEDDVSAKLQRSTAAWTVTAGWPDAAIAERIRADQIDILFDLSGHTGGNKLQVFARKPAPVQVSWLGYVGTTGLAAIDYLLTDAAMVPPEFDRFYRETVVRLPEGAACFTLPDDLPPVAPPPRVERGYVTFGSFNNPAKLTRQVTDTWAQILRQVPESRIVLKFRGLDEPTTSADFRGRFAAAGIDLSRVELRGRSTMAEMLQEYGDIDLALDPFPYNGGTTTMLAFAMGVPVISVPGDTVASRQTLSVARSIGFTDSIAANLDEYVALAVRLAGDPAKLVEWRGRLREQVLAAPFFNIDRWIPSFEQALRTMWKTWCERNSRG